jgi:hypothetical protein
MKAALAAAASRAGRQLLILTTTVPELTAPFTLIDKLELPGLEHGYLVRAIRD